MFIEAEAMGPCLVVLAKQPELGKVKTRIAKVIGDERATELYRCSLQDTLALATAITGVSHVLSFAPPTAEARRYFEDVAPAFELIPQQGATFGDRLSGTFAHLLPLYHPVVLIGSDSPDLPASIISEAFELLQQADAVLGPAADGGYYLLGLQAMQPMLFERIDWSTEVVAHQTRLRALEARLRIDELPVWHDLDTLDDLQALVPPGAPQSRAFVGAM